MPDECVGGTTIFEIVRRGSIPWLGTMETKEKHSVLIEGLLGPHDKPVHSDKPFCLHCRSYDCPQAKALAIDKEK